MKEKKEKKRDQDYISKFFFSPRREKKKKKNDVTDFAVQSDKTSNKSKRMIKNFDSVVGVQETYKHSGDGR